MEQFLINLDLKEKDFKTLQLEDIKKLLYKSYDLYQETLTLKENKNFSKCFINLNLLLLILEKLKENKKINSKIF